MNKEFIPYEQALALKELGFDEECFAYYYNKELSFGARVAYGEVIESPLKQQVFRWFREKYDLFGCIDLQVCTPSHWFIRIDDIIKNDYVYHSEDENLKYNTYEEAELACITELIEIVKKK
jgi:hypothetical protein